MRTREEILEDLYEGGGGDVSYWRPAILEILLDIRDLLSHRKEESN